MTSATVLAIGKHIVCTRIRRSPIYTSNEKAILGKENTFFKLSKHYLCLMCTAELPGSKYVGFRLGFRRSKPGGQILHPGLYLVETTNQWSAQRSFRGKYELIALEYSEFA